jgi:hypothetical protein
MTNSIDRPGPKRLLDIVLELLSESHLVKIIDDPVQSAVSTFVHRSPETDPYMQFVDTASRFYEHLCKCVGPFNEEMPAALVQRECMDLLEKRYRTAHGSGFHLAYLDALEDIEPVLSHMAGIVVSYLRERHARWVYFRWIAGLAWTERCALVKTLFDRSPFIPEPILKYPPPFMADRIFELVSAVVSANKSVESLLTGATSVVGD